MQFILLCVRFRASEIKYLIKSQRNSNRSRLAAELFFVASLKLASLFLLRTETTETIINKMRKKWVK